MEASMENVERKPYIKPAIIQELELETRAGSPIPGFIDPLNPTESGHPGTEGG